MPRWLSSQKVEVVRKILAEDPAMLCATHLKRAQTRLHGDTTTRLVCGRLRESLGISADGTEKAFPTTEIEAFMQRQAPIITHDVRRPLDNTQHTFLACDPSGGGASAFSIVSITQDAKGFLNVRFFFSLSTTLPFLLGLSHSTCRTTHSP